MQEKNATNVTFSERLHRLMEHAGVTAAELARKTGISHVAIGNYLDGRIPKVEQLFAIADALGTTGDVLYKGIQQPKEYGGPYWGTTNLVPVISWARAGTGHGYEDQGDDGEKVPTTCQDPNCYALEVEGDSMEPVYLPKDIVVVMPNREARNGDLVIARTLDDEETLFKLLKFSGDGRMAKLQSFNPHHPLIQMPKEGLRFLHPVHSVVRILRR